MGQVVIAEHLDLGRRVAIKLLRRELVRDAKTAERFRQEAKIVAKLKSPHVVRVFDVGSLDDGTPYIVMEFLEGEPLNRFIARNAPLPIEQAVEIILQALDGIAEAHNAGVVHRDLKPHNLFVTTRIDGARVIKVLDFGISKVATELSRITDASAAGITLPNEILGTPIYMAPEQVTNSKDVDGRADLWSMGVILREMITGKRLFQAASPSAVFANILRDPVPDLLTECESVPAGLDEVLARTLARDRDLRFSSAKDMAAALLPFAPVHGAHASLDAGLAGKLAAPCGSGGSATELARFGPAPRSRQTTGSKAILVVHRSLVPGRRARRGLVLVHQNADTRIATDEPHATRSFEDQLDAPAIRVSEPRPKHHRVEPRSSRIGTDRIGANRIGRSFSESAPAHASPSSPRETTVVRVRGHRGRLSSLSIVQNAASSRST